MDLIHPKAQQYAESYSSPAGSVQQGIDRFTLQHHKEYVMLSGHLQGKVLEMISHMVRPRRVLEIGTFTGYSAVCLAQGMTEDGILHTIELRESDAADAVAFFNQTSFRDRIITHVGNALDIIPKRDTEAGKNGVLQNCNYQV